MRTRPSRFPRLNRNAADRSLADPLEPLPRHENENEKEKRPKPRAPTGDSPLLKKPAVVRRPRPRRPRSHEAPEAPLKRVQNPRGRRYTSTGTRIIQVPTKLLASAPARELRHAMEAVWKQMPHLALGRRQAAGGRGDDAAHAPVDSSAPGRRGPGLGRATAGE